jgi:hypothetical protein
VEVSGLLLNTHRLLTLDEHFKSVPHVLLEYFEPDSPSAELLG